MNSFKLSISAAAAAAMMLLAACGPDSGEPGGGDGEPKSGGTLTYLSSNLGQSIDPVGAVNLSPANQSGYLLLAIYDALIMPTNGGYEPRLAESIESDDAVNWTMKLKEGVEFSDGTPFDAEAVKATWERNDKPGTTGFTVMENVASLTATDDVTLEIQLKTPLSQFPRLIALQLNAIGSPTAFEKDPEGFSTAPVGAGPFKVDKWVPDGELSLVRNDNYYNDPRPYLDRLVFKPVTDSAQALAALSTGDADAMWELSFDTERQAKDAGHAVESWEPTIGGCLLFNTASKPLDDVRVRKALVMAMNAQGYSDTIEFGLAPVPTSLFTDSSPFNNEDIPLPSYDKEQAQSLIDEVVAETGEPVQVTIAATPGPVQSAAEYFQSQIMTDIDNLEIEIEVPDRTTYVADVIAGKFQAFMYSINTMDPEPELYQTFGVESGNMAKYTDPVFQQALDTGRTSLSEDERRTAFETVQQTIADEALGAFYTRRTYGTIYNDDRVAGIEMIGQGAPLFDGAYVR